MKIIVDTCIWSLALRRNSVEDNPYIEELRNLIEEIHVQFIGPIRQELLNGIKSKKQFETLKLHLRAFADIELESKDSELAAEYFNAARKKGIQGSNSEPYIPFIPSNWNGIIVLAESQNLSSTNEDYVQYLNSLSISERMKRLSLGYDSIGVDPCDE